MSEIIYQVMIVLVFLVVAVGSWYHHSFACEGPPRVSGEIVVGDSVEEVMEKLNRKDV